ncbi:MAG: hypothetical protein LBP63_01065 [Prevotellaceae bacterium]|jgi:hypothetical protein|nr:hypothetical protein [Prevotellaceae bacterium]
MKTILIFLVTLISFGINTNAQSCIISGADDESTIEVQSCYLHGDKVIVNVINDSKDIAANVTVNVEVTYKIGNTINTKTYPYSGKEISLARVPTKIEIPIYEVHPSDNRYVAYSVNATSISGTKCK